jgi:hypothetical protein
MTRSFTHPLQVMAVDAARSDPPMPRARARACAVQRWEQERAACNKEKRVRRRERREQRDEEFWLREQHGLSPPATSEDSSSGEEEEESDGGRALLERWEPAPPSSRAAEATEKTAPGAGAGAPTEPMREATCAAKAPARTAEMTGVRRWPRRPRPQCPPSPRGRGTGLLHPEVGDRSPIRRIFEMSGSLIYRLCFRRVAPTVPPSHLPRC